MEVAQFDDIGVDDGDRADAHGGEVAEYGGTESAGADDEDVRVEQGLLRGFAEPG